MGYNKFITKNGKTMLDLTGITVSEKTLAKGETAIDRTGTLIHGMMVGGEYQPEGPEEDDSWWNTVNFYDYDGTLLYSYPVDEMQTATELPPLPSHEGLICQGWNWTLAKIKEYNLPIDVGANYVTDDGATRLYVNCFDEEHLTAAFVFMSPYKSESVTINYGDGTQEEYTVDTGWTGIEVVHTYSAIGQYVISISTQYLSSQNYLYFGNATNPVNIEVYTKVQCGDNIQGIDAGFCNNLETISISNSITTVNAKCATKLKALIGGLSTTIGGSEEALLNCQSLEVISFSPAQSRLEQRVFSMCNSLKRLTIPKNINFVYNYTSGDGCYSLELVVYGASNMGGRAWMDCKNLKKIILSNDIKQFQEYYTFRGTAIKDIQLPENLTSLGDGYIFQSCSRLESVTLPKLITNIPKYAFNGCTSLKSITIPDGVTTIGDYAFSGCSNLTSITIPDSVTSIGTYAFSGCSGLTSITIPDSVTSIGTYAFNGCGRLKNVVIGKGVNKIADYTFSQCKSLESVTGFDNITSIGNYAFDYCDNLTTLTIPSAVTSIGNYAFQFCSKMESLSIPEGVTSIGTKAFYGCYALKEMVIPASVTNSVAWFGYNRRLKTIIFNNKPTTIGDFNYACTLEEIDIPDSVTSLGSFVYSYSLVRINMPDSVTSIPSSCFSNCSSLRDVRLSERITALPASAFDSCKMLPYIKIPKSVTSLADKCFYNCNKLLTYDFSEHKSVPTLATTAVFSSKSGMQILVPSQLYNEWKSATNWTSWANYLVKTGNYLQNEPIKFTSLYNATESISLRYASEDDSLATNLNITANVPDIITISNQNITADTISFDITSLETEGEVVVTISVDIGGETLSSEVTLGVYETAPEPTYTVEVVDGAKYGFALNDSEYYESTNKKVGNSYSMCKLTFNTHGAYNLILDCINYAQNSYDYGLLSNVDTTLTQSYSADTANVYKTFKTGNSPSVVSVNYGAADNYEHFIYIKYIKNSYSDYYNDSLQFKVRFEAI